MENKERFIAVFEKNITRSGAKELLNYIENETDFFEAPASTRFHLSVPGGLCEHSLHVYSRTREMYKSEKGANLTAEEEEKLAIIALLHDLCKTNFYITEMRNQKTYDAEKVRKASPWDVKHDANGDFIWETVPKYGVFDSFPYGHGEKSVVLIEKFINLTDEEKICIRWHMGFSDDTFKGGSGTVGNAFNMFPLAAILHTADILASYLDEGDTKLF